MGYHMKRTRVAAAILALAASGVVAAPSLAASEGIPVYAESASDALARNVRILADSPQNFQALVGAGKAALQLGDATAAAGFFGRAAEVNPASPLPQAGIGAALVATGDPSEALTYFSRAEQLGASLATIGCDRGLAYDLLGRPAAAQADYRAALMSSDRDEARRRLALSLAISGNKAEALATLEPLLQQRDHGAVRVRALVLALNGEVSTAKMVLDQTMPGAGTRMDPFFRRLPTLTSDQKAAAVHLGIFPDSGAAFASNAAPAEDRLASIEQVLRSPEPALPQVSAPQYAYSAPAAAVQAQPPVFQLASVSRKAIETVSPSNDLIQTKRIASDGGGKRIWLQLASGSDTGQLPQEFDRIRSRSPSLFTGLSGWVADTGPRKRLLIGPFHTAEDARLFADALSNERIDSFSWTSQPGQVVRKLSNQ